MGRRRAAQCGVLPGELCDHARRRLGRSAWGRARAAALQLPPPTWNESHTVLDPVGRYQPRDYVSSDVLVVAGEPIQGEDPRVAHADAALRLPTSAERSEALAALGISVVVTDHTALGAAPAVAGRCYPAGSALSAVAVAGDVRQRTPPASWYAALGVAWAVFVAAGLLLPFVAWRDRIRAARTRS